MSAGATAEAAAPGAYKHVSAGDYHTCGLRADDTGYCWGSNSDGQLAVPAVKFETLDAGGNHACGVRDNDTLTCWGGNT